MKNSTQQNREHQTILNGLKTVMFIAVAMLFIGALLVGALLVICGFFVNNGFDFLIGLCVCGLSILMFAQSLFSQRNLERQDMQFEQPNMRKAIKSYQKREHNGRHKRK
jgi:hypothetical protein